MTSFYVALMLFTCSYLLAVPTGSSPMDTFTQVVASELPCSLRDDLIFKIKDFTSDKDSIVLGMTSKTIKKMTEKRNLEIKKRMLEIRKYCGFKRYLQLTSNGHKILSRFIRDSAPIVNTSGFLERETLCVRALINNICIIGDKLTDLNIVLPDINTNMSQVVELATNAYFSALIDLFNIKSNFGRVSVSNEYEFIGEFLHREVENKILHLLSHLTIDSLDIQFKIRNPRLLVNPSIKKLSAHQAFFSMNYYPELAGLESVIFPDFVWSQAEMQSFSKQSDTLRIASLYRVKELTLPSYLVTEALSDRYSCDKLNIYGSYGIRPEPDYLDALIETDKELTRLKFGKYLNPPLQSMATILAKFKLSLHSLSLFYESDSHVAWENVLSTLLSENYSIKELEVGLDNEITFSHSFLEQAVNLSSYSFIGRRVSGTHIKRLLHFVATHKSLVSISLKFTDWIEESADAFEIFYENLVAAVNANPSIKRVGLFIRVTVSSLSTSALLFSERSKPLVGRGLILNSIPIDNIVSDLANGLKDGLLWKFWVSRDTQTFSMD